MSISPPQHLSSGQDNLLSSRFKDLLTEKIAPPENIDQSSPSTLLEADNVNTAWNQQQDQQNLSDFPESCTALHPHTFLGQHTGWVIKTLHAEKPSQKTELRVYTFPFNSLPYFFFWFPFL